MGGLEVWGMFPDGFGCSARQRQVAVGKVHAARATGRQQERETRTLAVSDCSYEYEHRERGPHAVLTGLRASARSASESLRGLFARAARAP